MGISTSKSHRKVTIQSENGYYVSQITQDTTLPANNGNYQGEIQFTESEKKLLTESWETVKNDVEKIGAITFTNLFEAHTDVKEKFIPFKSIDVDDARYNRILRNHGLKVLNTVSKMITRLDQPEKMRDMITALGTRHSNYNANADLFEIMSPHFVKAIHKSLESSWTNELEDAYTHLFQVLEFYMRISFIKALDK